MDHKLLVPSNGGENGAKAKYRIYHTPDQFVKFAKTLTHPFDVEHRVPDVLRQSIFQMLCGGVQELANKRLEQSKRFQNMEVCELLQGVNLVGEASKSPLFGEKVVQATTTPELLLRSSVSSNQKICSRNVHEKEDVL